MNTIQLTQTVGTIAAKDYRKAEVFKSIGIEFCCNGDKTLNEASHEAGVTAEELIAALDQITLVKTSPTREFNEWELDPLIDYIINTHHRYARENAVMIYDLAQNVANHHSEKHPELTKLVTALFLFLNDLLNHLKKEEQILFPNIKQLVRKKRSKDRITYTTFGFIKQTVIEMKKEHLASCKELKLFRKLTNNYVVPTDACISYKYLLEKIKEFEDNLILHVHLENNILFPKATALDNVETW